MPGRILTRAPTAAPHDFEDGNPHRTPFDSAVVGGVGGVHSFLAMAYHSDYYDTEEYADKPNATHCEECGQRYEYCQCIVQEYASEEDPGQPSDLFDAFNKSGDEADLPF